MDFRVHRDHEVALLRHLGVPLLDLLLDPRRESVAEDGVRHVDEPLLGQPCDLALVRVVDVGVRELSDELLQSLHLQRLVLRHLEVLRLVVLEAYKETE